MILAERICRLVSLLIILIILFLIYLVKFVHSNVFPPFDLDSSYYTTFVPKNYTLPQ